MKNNINKIEITGVVVTFLILIFLQMKSNLMPLYFPLFLFVIAIGYYRKIILQMIVILNLSFIYLTVNQVQMYSEIN